MKIEYYWFKYMLYYMNHTENVLYAWIDISNVLLENGIITKSECLKIGTIILKHDASKMSKEEFQAYALKYFPIEPSVSYDEFFKEAWQHHKDNNLHHHQSLKNYTGPNRKFYLIEMICDWIAMGWELETLAEDYYYTNKNKIELPEEDKILIEKILVLIKKNNCFASKKLTRGDRMKIIGPKY